VVTFPIDQLQNLQDWLKEQFIEFKPGAGSYQLIRIKTLKKGYRGIYQSPHDRNVFLVDAELDSTINALFARKQK